MHVRIPAPIFLVALALAGTLAAPAVARAGGTTGTVPVERWAGGDRFATAASISAHTFAAECGCTAYVAYAYNFPDALAGAAAAGTLRGPVLLVAATGPVHAATHAELVRLHPAKIVVLGSEAAISDAVYDELATYAPSIERYGGATRFATAAAISAATFPAGCGCTAYVAWAYNFPDALAAAAAAGKLKGPVLLVGPSTPIDTATADELRRLRPTRIVVLGSTAVVPDAVFAALGQLAPSIERWAGADRFATAAAISAHAFPAGCGCTAIVAYAYDFPDALAGAAAAGSVGGPVLLVDSVAALNPSTVAELRRLAPTRIVVLGSTGVVSDAVATALAAYRAPADATYTKNLYAASWVRYQDPDYTACTAAATLTMLNFVASSGSGGSGFAWQRTTSYTRQEEILRFERGHMTMVASSAGTDPHGWRNALNAYGWGTYTSASAFRYADRSYGTFDEAVKAAVSAMARTSRPVGLLGWAGGHAQILNGYEAYGQNPATSSDFSVVAVYLTDPLAGNALRNARIDVASLRGGPTVYRFRPYLETDSPYDDPYTAGVSAAKSEWYGRWVIVVPVG